MSLFHATRRSSLRLPRTAWFACALAAATPAFLSGQTVANGSFELGTFSPTVSFAGGTAVNFPGNTPTGWSYAASGNGDTDRWIQSGAAKDGSRFILLSSTGRTDFPTTTFADDCMEVPITGLVQNGQYQLCVWAADAGSTTTSSYIRFELDSDKNGTSETLSLLNASYQIPANLSWNNTTQTLIPWKQYVFPFTYTRTPGSLNYGNATLWLSANVGSVANGTLKSTIVIDAFELKVVPEPASVAAVLGAFATGAALWRRRRRSS